MDVYRVNIILWAIYVFATVCLFTISAIQKIQSFESWIKTYKGFAWGNEGGVY